MYIVFGCKFFLQNTRGIVTGFGKSNSDAMQKSSSTPTQVFVNGG